MSDSEPRSSVRLMDGTEINFAGSLTPGNTLLTPDGTFVVPDVEDSVLDVRDLEPM